jgi:hypothetical protein
MCNREVPETVRGVAEGPVRCESCGHVQRRWLWRPGARCPACDSDRFVPLVVPEGAYDYALADRSDGPAPEDHRLARLARWGGLVHANPVADVIRELRKTASSGITIPPIGDALVDKGILTRRAVSGLLRALATPRDPDQERLFCDLAVTNGFITREQAERCLQQQQELADEGHQIPFIGFLLMESRALSDPQVLAIMRAEKRRGKGLLAELEAALGQEKETPKPQAPEAEGLLAEGGWRRSRIVATTAVIVTLAAVTVMVREWVGEAPSATPMIAMCASCHAHFEIHTAQPPPYTCKQCGRRTAWVAMRCLDCNHIFLPVAPDAHNGANGSPSMTPGQNLVDGRPPCPKCKSTNTVTAVPEDAPTAP